MRHVFCFYILLFASPALATGVSGGLTYQGRIIKPDNTPLEAASVVFRLQVRSPEANNCVLYEESHTVDMRNTGGVFSLSLGSGVRSGDDPGLNFKDVFSNAMNFAGPLTCASGTSYNPASGHARKLRVTFNDGGGDVALTPDMNIQSVPYAFYAEKLQGKGASDLLQVNTSGANSLTQANLQAAFTNTNQPKLMDLINGVSAQYLRSSPTSSVSFNSQRLTDLADPTAAQDAATKNYCDMNMGGNTLDDSDIASGVGDGKVLTWDAAGNKWVAEDPPSGADDLGNHTATTDLDMATNKIVNLADPTAAQDAATKNYVDTKLITKTLPAPPTNAEDGMALMYDDGTGAWVYYTPISAGADNLGDHTATQNIELGPNYLSGDGDNEGISVDGTGRVGIATATPQTNLHVNGSQLLSGTLYVGSNSMPGSGINVAKFSGSTLEFNTSPAGYSGPFFIGAAQNQSSPTNGGNLTIYAQSSNASGTNTGGDLILKSGAGSTGQNLDGAMRFFIGANEKVRVDKTGNVGIGTPSPNASSLVDISSTTKGFLLPRMTTGERDAIASPAAGLQVYNTSDNKLQFYNGSAWVDVGTGVGVATSRQLLTGDGLTGGGDLSSDRTLSVSLATDPGLEFNSGALRVKTGSGIVRDTAGINHADTSSQSSVDNTSGAVIQDVTLDTYGHLTGVSSVDLDTRYYTETEADNNYVNITGDNMTGGLSLSLNGSGSPQWVTGLNVNSTGSSTRPGISFHANGSGVTMIGQSNTAAGDPIATGILGSNSSLSFYTGMPVAGAGDDLNVSSQTPKMHIASGGNVGIGTSGPAYKLDVSGQLNGSEVCISGDCRSSWPAAGSTSTTPLVTKLTAANYAAGGFTAGVSFTPDFNAAPINNLGGSNLAADRVDIPSDGVYLLQGSAYYCPQTNHYTVTNITVGGASVATTGSAVAGGCRTDFVSTVRSLTAGQNVSMTVFDSANGPSSGISSIELIVTKLNSAGTKQLTDDDGNTKIEAERSANDDTIRMATAGTDRVTVTATGNVGIGTASPGYQMHVFGAGQTTAALSDSGNKGGMIYVQDSGGLSGNGGGIMLGNGHGNFAAVKSLVSNGGPNPVGHLAFSTRNSTGDSSLTERMRIADTGNVGIGTTTPAATLDVNGQMIRSVFTTTLTGACNNENPPANVWHSVLSSFTYNKKSASSKLLITVSGTMRFNYTFAGWGLFGLLINGTDNSLCGIYNSTGGDFHQSPFCRTIVSGLGTGNWTIQPRINQASTGWYCLGNAAPLIVTIEEIY